MKKILSPIGSALGALARLLGRALAFLISFLFYFLVLGPYSIVARIAVRDLLDKKPDSRLKTYWRRMDDGASPPERPF